MNLPVPVINIALGAGAGMVGEGELSNGAKLTADDSQQQVFCNTRLPDSPAFDVHVGYQVINGNKAEVKNPSGGIEYERDPSGTVWTAGIKIGF